MSLADDPVRLQALGGWIADRLGLAVGSDHRGQAAPGGAIQENWRISCRLDDDADAPARDFVLRRNAPATIGSSRPLAQEFALLSAAHQAGVLVPTPIGYCDDPLVVGDCFSLVSVVAGVGLGPRIVKDTSLGGDRAALAARLGRGARAHPRIRLPQPALSFLGARPPTRHRPRSPSCVRRWIGWVPPGRPWNGGCAGRSCMRPSGRTRA